MTKKFDCTINILTFLIKIVYNLERNWDIPKTLIGESPSNFRGVGSNQKIDGQKKNIKSTTDNFLYPRPFKSWDLPSYFIREADGSSIRQEFQSEFSS